ncbi:BMC domain-containing protein [Clostridium tetani]|uniref:Carbon dioxide concentrating mechanism protein ccmK-like protein n=1 Tax=Clostridium tetani (strain Massachusetts / E88) TaxID=212717 RepID=Q894U2_CLOTE|nr:BMC domain-containing protein [Clostridium tetani]AAO36000.1 carbon dioxide concentrating mechanism protein ccmK-like protein [Clostridium tetani E88]KGI38052.1 propanediol utilization protein [Clostridium tetani]KGI43143.1 propanediol utilization protein [Clostridium tetani]KHO32141.1 propanediol utilization protein [Clostridium tetani]KIG19983.1 propanediol utilization protein [Clostridium tetani]
MQALGLIETKGLLAAVEAADVMVKSADVSIIEKTYVGGGLVTISVTGDVGAVKASIEAGAAAVKNLNEEFLVSEHVIPRPHEELESIIGSNNLQEDSSSNEDTSSVENVEKAEVVETTEALEEEQIVEDIYDSKNLKDVDTENKIKENQEKLDEDLDKVNLEKLHKNNVDNLVSKNGLEKTISILNKLKVASLRSLAGEYKDFGIKVSEISKADKNLLIKKFKLYYEKN